MPAGVALVEDAEADGMGSGVESEGRRARGCGQGGTQEYGRGEAGERGRYSVTA